MFRKHSLFQICAAYSPFRCFNSLGFSFFTQFFAYYMMEKFGIYERQAGLIFGWGRTLVGIHSTYISAQIIRQSCTAKHLEILAIRSRLSHTNAFDTANQPLVGTSCQSADCYCTGLKFTKFDLAGKRERIAKSARRNPRYQSKYGFCRPICASYVRRILDWVLVTGSADCFRSFHTFGLGNVYAHQTKIGASKGR